MNSVNSFLNNTWSMGLRNRVVTGNLMSQSVRASEPQRQEGSDGDTTSPAPSPELTNAEEEALLNVSSNGRIFLRPESRAMEEVVGDLTAALGNMIAVGDRIHDSGSQLILDQYNATMMQTIKKMNSIDLHVMKPLYKVFGDNTPFETLSNGVMSMCETFYELGGELNCELADFNSAVRGIMQDLAFEREQRIELEKEVNLLRNQLSNSRDLISQEREANKNLQDCLTARDNQVQELRTRVCEMQLRQQKYSSIQEPMIVDDGDVTHEKETPIFKGTPGKVFEPTRNLIQISTMPSSSSTAPGMRQARSGPPRTKESAPTAARITGMQTGLMPNIPECHQEIAVPAQGRTSMSAGDDLTALFAHLIRSQTLPKLEPFDGKGRFADFIENFELRFSKSLFHDNDLRVNLVQHLTGDVRNYFNSLPENVRYGSYEGVKSALMNRNDSMVTRLEARNKLQRLTINASEPIAEFVCRVEQVAKRAISEKGERDLAMAHKICEQLSPWSDSSSLLRLLEECNDGERFEAVKAQALRMEATRKMEVLMKGSAHEVKHSVQQRPNVGFSNLKHSSPVKINAQLQRSVVSECSNCGGTGHRAAVCTSRSRQPTFNRRTEDATWQRGQFNNGAQRQQQYGAQPQRNQQWAGPQQEQRSYPSQSQAQQPFQGRPGAKPGNRF